MCSLIHACVASCRHLNIRSMTLFRCSRCNEKENKNLGGGCLKIHVSDTALEKQVGDGMSGVQC